MTNENTRVAGEKESSGPIGLVIALGFLFVLGCYTAENPCVVMGQTITAPDNVRIPSASGPCGTNALK
jgi:hypothetical protein